MSSQVKRGLTAEMVAVVAAACYLVPVIAGRAQRLRLSEQTKGNAAATV